jgi:calcineurin-like phosphoesterase family protein
LFDNLASNVNKRDSLVILGDVAFTLPWLMRLKDIKCQKKTLILGNHDTDRAITMQDQLEVFDSIHSLWSKRNMWLSHCPIHPMEMRGKTHNIHGHLHSAKVDDPRYINVCVEHTDWKPIRFDSLY